MRLSQPSLKSLISEFFIIFSIILIAQYLFTAKTFSEYGRYFFLEDGYIHFMMTVVVLFAFALIIQRISTMRKARRHFPNILGANEEFEIYFNQLGIEHSSEGAFSRLEWAIVKYVLETKQHFFLGLGPYNAVIVPKRLFSDALQLDAFRGFVHRRAGVGSETVKG